MSAHCVQTLPLWRCCSHIPVSLDEIADISRFDKKKLGYFYRLLLWSLAIKIPLNDPIDHISRFSSQLSLSSPVQLRAVEILQQSRARGLTIGRDPLGLAAAAIYIASIMLDERRTQREVAEVTKITEVTVRNRYKDMVKTLGIDTMTIG